MTDPSAPAPGVAAPAAPPNPYQAPPAGGWPGHPPAYPGYAPYGHPPQAYAYPVHPYAVGRRTSGMAIASMVTSLLALATICLYGLPTFVLGPVGAIMGHLTRRRIRTTGEEGDGMALAGIIIGWVSTGLAVLWLVVIVLLVLRSMDTPPPAAPADSF